MALQTERKDEPQELKGPFNLRIRTNTVPGVCGVMTAMDRYVSTRTAEARKGQALEAALFRDTTLPYIFSSATPVPHYMVIII